MKLKIPRWLILSTVVFLHLSTPKTAPALDLIVEHTRTDPSHFTTIQNAITYVTGVTPTTTNFRIVVEPSPTPYAGPITLISNVPIIGRETARTFISGNSTNTVITASNIVGVTIKNFTFLTAGIGIDVSNNADVNITGNVFQVGSAGTAVRVQSSPNAEIINNTFYLNNKAIINGADDILITNNIFSTNALAIESQALLTRTSYNAYHNNTNNGNVTLDLNSLPNASVANPDPLFVDPAKLDFHLQVNSPCHSYAGTNAGNPNYANAFDITTFDMGAYGGPDSDTIPYPVSISSYSTTTITPLTVNLQWTDNPAYSVKGYNIYYGYSPGARDGNDAIVSGGTATVGPRIDAGNANTIALIVSRTSTSTLLAPHLNGPLLPLAGSLKLNWTAVSGATGYNIYYSLASAPSISILGKPVTGGGTTEETLSGLTDGVLYNVWVTTLSQAKYYFSVTAYDTNTSAGTPGIAHESDYSDEQEVAVGNITESGPSNIETGTPEPITPTPNLPNTGCFIASAAYGSANEPAVQLLRDFRDQYLATNAAGRAFVRWYYTNGPVAAGYLNAHPALKPFVRALLSPAVAGAFLLTRAPAAVQAALLLGLIAAVALIIRRRTGSRETTA